MAKEKNLASLSKEISRLKRELANVNVDKENWFKEKEDQKNKIKELISEIKSLKGKKDNFNVVYQELKKKRDEYNNKVKD